MDCVELGGAVYQYDVLIALHVTIYLTGVFVLNVFCWSLLHYMIEWFKVLLAQ